VIYFLNLDFYMKCFLIPKLMLLSKIAMSQIMLPAYQGVVSKIPAVVTPSFSCGPSTVSDIDGNIYNTVLIGTQCWTKENLKVSKYNDGTTIPNQTANTNWGTLLTGALTVYIGAASYLATYGYLYNWYAAKDTREICPTGWHVPTNTEWETLNTYLGGKTIAGGKMKSTSSLWTSPNIGAVNTSGFSALPGGTRHTNGSFYNIGVYALFWSATEYDGNGAWSNHVKNSVDDVFRGSGDKTSGFSVRCLRD
jgi:uncharacterized protein (TIGR02145 family)